MRKLMAVSLIFGLALAQLAAQPLAGGHSLEDVQRDLSVAAATADGALSPRQEGVYAEQGLLLNGYVSVWSQDCSGEQCGIALPLVKNRALDLELPLPQAPGQARSRVIREVFSLAGAGSLSLKLSFYAVCPYAGVEVPAERGPGACSGLYFQAQLDLSGAAEAFCASSLNEKDLAPFPVVMCGGAKTGGTRLGVTLHRIEM